MFSRLNLMPSNNEQRWESESMDPSLLLEQLALGGVRTSGVVDDKSNKPMHCGVYLSSRETSPGSPLKGQVFFSLPEPIKTTSVTLTLHGYVYKIFGNNEKHEQILQRSFELSRDAHSPLIQPTSNLNLNLNTLGIPIKQYKHHEFTMVNSQLFISRRAIKPNKALSLPFEIEFPEFLPSSGDYKVNGDVFDEMESDVFRIGVAYFLSASVINEWSSVTVCQSPLKCILLENNIANGEVSKLIPTKEEEEPQTFEMSLLSVHDNRFFSSFFCRACISAPKFKISIGFSQFPCQMNLELTWESLLRSKDDIQVKISLVEVVSFGEGRKNNTNTIWAQEFLVGSQQKGKKAFQCSKKNFQILPEMGFRWLSIKHYFSVVFEPEDARKETFKFPVSFPEYLSKSLLKKNSLFSVEESERPMPKAEVTLTYSSLQITQA